MELEFHQMAMRYSGLRISMPGLEGRLTASLASVGQLHPLMVVKNEAGPEEYVLIDGYRRVSVLRKLGRDTVEGVVLPMSESGALIFRHCQKSTHNQSALEDGWLLRELIDGHGMSQADLARFLQRSEAWVSKRLSLVKVLPLSVQELVRTGEVCGYLAMRYLVPFARAKKSDCEKLAQGLSGHRVSTRQMEWIYAQWKRSNSDGRRRVVENPLLFLKTAEELRTEPEDRNGDDTESILEDMEILDAVSGRARRRIRELGLGMRFPDTLIESWRTAQSSFSALTVTMERRVNAGHGDKGGDYPAESRGSRDKSHRESFECVAEFGEKGAR